MNRVSLFTPLVRLTRSSQQLPASRHLSSSKLGGIFNTLFDVDHVEPQTSSHSAALGLQSVYCLQFMKTKPEFTSDYRNASAEALIPYTKHDDNKPCILLGAFKTDIGDQDEFVFLWKYLEGYSNYASAEEYLHKDEAYQKFKKTSSRWLTSRNSQILMQFSYWNEPKPRPDRSVYELRTYDLKPGTMIDWANAWAKGIEFRREYNQDVGGFFTQIGPLYQVHHLWAYQSLVQRKKTRENMWEKPGWDSTVKHTVPLMRSMQSRIMLALPYSPMQ